MGDVGHQVSNHFYWPTIVLEAKLAELSDGEQSGGWLSVCAHFLLTEFQSQLDSMSRFGEENRKLRSDYYELRLQYDDEVYNGSAWKRDRGLEAKISDITNVNESSAAARSGQQSQIAALHSQVRELKVL